MYAASLNHVLQFKVRVHVLKHRFIIKASGLRVKSSIEVRSKVILGTDLGGYYLVWFSITGVSRVLWTCY